MKACTAWKRNSAASQGLINHELSNDELGCASVICDCLAAATSPCARRGVKAFQCFRRMLSLCRLELQSLKLPLRPLRFPATSTRRCHSQATPSTGESPRYLPRASNAHCLFCMSCAQNEPRCMFASTQHICMLLYLFFADLFSADWACACHVSLK